MKLNISVSKSIYHELPIISDKDYKSQTGKGWSFSNIYNLRLLKDVYLLIAQNQALSEKQLKRLIQEKITFDKINEKNDWDDNGRNALEYINALKNYNLITADYKIIKEYFVNSNLNDEISENEKKDLKLIFFSYLRFKELSSWFTTNDSIDTLDESYVKTHSHPVFCFSLKSRFTDSLIYNFKDNADVYFINEKMSHVMRFWDVFTKWGIELSIMEKINISQLGYNINGLNKAINLVYFINDELFKWDILTYFKENYQAKYISIIGLVLKLIIDFRCTVEYAKDFIIQQSLKYKQYFSLQKTSETFVNNEMEERFLPICNGSYVSHILLK